MDFIKQYSNQDEEELEIVQYGIEVFFINLFKLSFLLIIAWLLGVINPLMILLISFACIRLFAAGVHAPSTWLCTLLNLVFFLGGTYICINISINPLLRFSLFLISILLLSKYAPADTEDRPLVSSRLRRRLKFQSIGTSLILLFIMLSLNNEIYQNLITCGVCFGALMTTPVIYYIFRKGYRNYEKFNEQL